MPQKPTSEYVIVFNKVTHLLLLIVCVLHILRVYLGNSGSVEPTVLLEMSDVIVPILLLWLCLGIDMHFVSLKCIRICVVFLS